MQRPYAPTRVHALRSFSQMSIGISSHVQGAPSCPCPLSLGISEEVRLSSSLYTVISSRTTRLRGFSYLAISPWFLPPQVMDRRSTQLFLDIILT
jgi:hypothetical protein